MRKFVLLFAITLMTSNFCNAQEWFTSFDVAKRLAIVQDKMLFVIWEESLDDVYPLLYNNAKGDLVVTDLSEDNSLDELIWEHFVPVLLPEEEYAEFINDSISEKTTKYMTKLNDDSIKIMDINGNILNATPDYDEYDTEQNLSLIIKKYALNSSFLKQELINYSKKGNLTTAFNLASKYLDYAIFVQKAIRPEIIDLANIYFNEAKQYVLKEELKNKNALLQRFDLLDIKGLLVLDKPKRARRLLKKIDVAEISQINKSIYIFLNYTTFKLLNEEDKSVFWKDKISKVDLKKAGFIIKNNN
jgi:hypothetical protein